MPIMQRTQFEPIYWHTHNPSDFNAIINELNFIVAYLTMTNKNDKLQKEKKPG